MRYRLIELWTAAGICEPSPSHSRISLLSAIAAVSSLNRYLLCYHVSALLNSVIAVRRRWAIQRAPAAFSAPTAFSGQPQPGPSGPRRIATGGKVHRHRRHWGMPHNPKVHRHRGHWGMPHNPRRHHFAAVAACCHRQAAFCRRLPPQIASSPLGPALPFGRRLAIC